MAGMAIAVRSLSLIPEPKLAEIINVYRTVEISTHEGPDYANHANATTRSQAILSAVETLQRLLYMLNLSQVDAQKAANQVSQTMLAIQFIEVLSKNK